MKSPFSGPPRMRWPFIRRGNNRRINSLCFSRNIDLLASQEVGLGGRVDSQELTNVRLRGEPLQVFLSRRGSQPIDKAVVSTESLDAFCQGLNITERNFESGFFLPDKFTWATNIECEHGPS